MDESPGCRTESLVAADLYRRERLRAAADRARLLKQSGTRPHSPVGTILVKLGRALIKVGNRFEAQESSSTGLSTIAIHD